MAEAEDFEINAEDVASVPAEVLAAEGPTVDPAGSGDPEDVCPAPVFRDGAWQRCGEPNTHAVVFAGLAPQRFCEEHHGNAAPSIPVA